MLTISRDPMTSLQYLLGLRDGPSSTTIQYWSTVWSKNCLQSRGNGLSGGRPSQYVTVHDKAGGSTLRGREGDGQVVFLASYFGPFLTERCKISASLLVHGTHWGWALGLCKENEDVNDRLESTGMHCKVYM